MKTVILLPVLVLLLATLCGCTSMTTGKTPLPPTVPALDVKRYAGTWYEIARLPHFFERDLARVSATYTLRDDGCVTVLNRGFNTRKNAWAEITGLAWCPDPQEPALLKVRFFWPFRADYRIIALDEQNYGWSVVCGPNRKYLWILARQPQLDETCYQRLVTAAQGWGFDTAALIRVSHDQP